MAGRKMTPKGQMAFGGGPPITHLPPAMKAMFQPGPPIPFKEKLTKKKCPPYTGVATWVSLFETTPAPDRILLETPRQIKEKAHQEKMKRNQELLAEAIEKWDPAKGDEGAELTADAYKTLFVARLSYETTEKKLRREFEQFGDIKTIRMVTVRRPKSSKSEDDMMMDEGDDDDDDKVGKPRGYAFVEFEREADMRAAYKRADGRKVDGRRILVDVERGRTVRNWKPRRLGGGLGSTRKGASAAAAAASSSSRPSSSAATPRPVSDRRADPPRSSAAESSRRDEPRRRSRSRDRDRRDRERRDRERSRRDRSRSRDRDRRR